MIFYQLLTIRCDIENNNNNIACDISKVVAVRCDILTVMHRYDTIYVWNICSAIFYQLCFIRCDMKNNT